ncbi:hypothetical protein [Actinomadura verrucosospora]|uniref:Uncharacterized protein n=1 Tax=Actinomadura verrucosospora TaxID=46165 RepID=A0A7D3ZXF3_ACTVE|nr:hypothetical protein [Actinomadura verrucosospora]QKG22005.1 hypothetical protein ACTIVE_3643 [Actinomadura verrucosospora]QKG22006.1 hypothetical protein ACTIVE_3644 [Actinomadura verrucosospora]
MSQTNPHTFSYAELDRLSGEVLPERAVLSTLLTGGGDNTSKNININDSGSGDPSTAVSYACQYSHSTGTPGLLGTGLLAEPGYTTTTCVPVVVHHSA